MPGERILVVDDDPDVVELCRRILASEGYLVKGATSGQEALEIARGEPFDLLLVDIRMPGMNGMETYQAIKEFDPDIIGVVITGYASMDTAIEAIKLGFDGFVTKPFTPGELNAAVAKALERERLESENARLRALIPLFEMSKSFMATMDLDELLNQVVHVAKRETKADRVSLMLLDKRSGELTIEAAVGLPQEVMATTRIRLGEGIAGRAAKCGEPLLLNDKASLDHKVKEAMKSDVISSALCVPLKVKDRVIGVLNLSKLEGTPFAEGDLEMASILCGQAAIAIENARLYEASQRELAERKRAEEQIQASLKEKEALLKEIHHRVRNNLQVVSSLLDFQSEYIKDQQPLEMFKESQNRIRSMAFIHEQLYQSKDLARIDFAKYIRGLTDCLFQSYGVNRDAITMNINADDVLLGVDTAIPCGLIINELVSNSLKHAFPGGRKGEIRIDLRSDDDKLTLIVSDNGVGFPEDLDLLNTKTLGLRLVNMLTRQLKGTMEFDKGSGTAKITFARPKAKGGAKT